MSRELRDAAARWHRIALAAVFALTLTELLWVAMARGSRRARQAASLLLPIYFGEALVRALSESGRHALVAALAAGLAVVAFAALLASFRSARNGV